MRRTRRGLLLRRLHDCRRRLLTATGVTATGASASTPLVLVLVIIEMIVVLVHHLPLPRRPSDRVVLAHSWRERRDDQP